MTDSTVQPPLQAFDAHLAIESVKDYAIFGLDPRGIVRSWNEGARALKGYAPGEIIGDSFTRFYTREDVSAGKPQRLLQIAADQGRVEDEGWRVRKDGSTFWADVVITALRAPDGQLRGFVKVTRDLTARRAAQEALRQGEERLRLMVESVKDYAIFMLDPSGHVTSWNSGAERLKGYTAAEIIGRHLSTFYSEEDVRAGKPARELEIATETGRFEDEGWRVRKDGSRFWANVVLSVARDDRGQLVGFAKITRDVSERKRSEEALVQRARQQAAVAQLGLFALEKPDVDFVMRRAIDTARDTLATDVVNVLELSDGGSSFVLRASTVADEAEIGNRVADVDRRSQAGYTVFTSEPVQLDRERFTPGPFLEAKRVAAGITAMIRGSDRPHGAYGVLAAHSSFAREFTADDVNFLQAVANLIAAALERKRMEEQVRVAEQKAQEERVRAAQARDALRERDDFISVAAHELRTPLTALQLKLQGLERVVRTGARADSTAKSVSARLEGALRQTERLGILVERLLDVTRIAGGRLELAPERLDLATLLRQVADDFREPAAAVGSEIRVEAPATVEGIWDRLRMEQVLVNLLSNAVKYGGGRPISARLSATNDRVRLTIADQGIGIAPEDVERIFSRFGRAAPVRNYGGLGLGLYITKHIVEAHGGAIEVTSRVGHGATFVIDLPVAFLQPSEAEDGQRRARA